MEIIIGKNAGFCYGVKNAVESAKRELSNTTENIYFLGEIVHNRQVTNDLRNCGAIFIKNLDDAKGSVVIRAHGVAKEVYEEAENKGIRLMDYTCPNVLKIHRIAKEYASKGYYIILIGSRKHPENIGTISYCGNNAYVVEDEIGLYNVIDLLNNWNVKDVLVISQTTFNLETFYTFQSILEDELKTNINLVIENTICNATQIRQQETEQLSKEVDYMIIVGGKNSSNTTKLLEVAEDNCRGAIRVEEKEDLKGIDFSLINRIGIMAGASTPQSSIDEIYNYLNEKYN